MIQPIQIENINIPYEAIEAFCKKWLITELALFGSVLRGDFTPDSDIDVLVTFAPESRISLFNRINMEDELADIFARKVDLVSKQAVLQDNNPYRREPILKSYRVIYGTA